MEREVLTAMGRFLSVDSVNIQVELMDKRKAASFRFSRVCTAPQLPLHFFVGHLDRVNVRFPAADADISCEDLLVGNTSLSHIAIDYRRLLEQNKSALDASNYSLVGTPVRKDEMGQVGRLFVARLQSLGGYGT